MTTILEAKKLTFADAAEELGFHVNTIRRWTTIGVKGRKLRSIRIGGRRFVLVKDLEAFVDNGQPADED
jgi:hypothetical protein